MVINRIVQTRGSNDALLIFDTNTRLAYVPMVKIEHKDMGRIEEMSELCLAGKRIAREILDAGFNVKMLWMRYYGLSVNIGSVRERRDIADLCRRAIRTYAFSGNEVRRFSSRSEMLEAYDHDSVPIGRRLDSASESGDIIRGYDFPPPVFQSPESDVATYLSVVPARRSLLSDNALRFLERIEEIEGVERVEFRANGLVSVSIGKAFLWSEIEPRIADALMLLAGSSAVPGRATEKTVTVPDEPLETPKHRVRRPHWKPRAEMYMRLRIARLAASRVTTDKDISVLLNPSASESEEKSNEDDSIPGNAHTPQPFWPF